MPVCLVGLWDYVENMSVSAHRNCLACREKTQQSARGDERKYSKYYLVDKNVAIGGVGDTFNG